MKRNAFFRSLSQAGIQSGCSGSVGKHIRRMHTFTTKCVILQLKRFEIMILQYRDFGLDPSFPSLHLRFKGLKTL